LKPKYAFRGISHYDERKKPSKWAPKKREREPSKTQKTTTKKKEEGEKKREEGIGGLGKSRFDQWEDEMTSGRGGRRWEKKDLKINVGAGGQLCDKARFWRPQVWGWGSGGATWNK